MDQAVKKGRKVQEKWKKTQQHTQKKGCAWTNVKSSIKSWVSNRSQDVCFFMWCHWCDLITCTVCWRERTFPSSYVSEHICCWGDGSLIHRAAFRSFGDRSAQHGWQLWGAVRGDSRQIPQCGQYSDSPSLLLGCCWLLNLGPCPRAAAGRSCWVWKWACCWPCWWPALQDRPVTGGTRGRPAMEDLTCTLFWTSEYP